MKKKHKAEREFSDSGNQAQLYHDLLGAMLQMINIICALKQKLDEILAPTSVYLASERGRLPREIRSELIKGLVSHIAFTTKKMVGMVPDLEEPQGQADVKLMIHFLQQQTFTVRENVIAFITTLNKGDADQPLHNRFQFDTIEKTSQQLDSSLAHMSNTIQLLHNENTPVSRKARKLFLDLSDIIKDNYHLLSVAIGAEASDSLNSFSKSLCQRAEAFQSSLESSDTFSHLAEGQHLQVVKAINKEVNRIIAYVTEASFEVSNKLTQIPVYAEQHYQTVREQIRIDFFLLMCNIQQSIVLYPLKIQPKTKKVLDLKPSLNTPRKFSSIPHVESSTIGNHPSHFDHISADAKLPTSRKSRGIKRFLLPLIHTTTPEPSPRVETPPETLVSLDWIKSPRSSTLLQTQEFEDLNCKSRALSLPELAELSSIQPPHEESIEYTRTPNASEEVNEPKQFISKRPKISRAMSKSKLFSAIDHQEESPKPISTPMPSTLEHNDYCPESRLTKAILTTLRQDVRWFNASWSNETPEKISEIEQKIGEMIKRELVLYGNKFKPLITPRSVQTPRSGPKFMHQLVDLEQFVNPDIAPEQLRDVYHSTTSLLSPLKIPRIKACSSSLSMAADSIISLSFSVVDHPLDESLTKQLSDKVESFYEKLGKIVQLTTEGIAMAAIFEIPLAEQIQNSPTTGEVNSELINMIGEAYQLHSIARELQKQVYYSATGFHCVALQLRIMIWNIAENSVSNLLITQILSLIYTLLRSVVNFLDLVATSRMFLLHLSTNVLASAIPLARSYKYELSDVNIWEASPVDRKGDLFLGTLNSFVLQLTETENELDNYFLKAFLVTYQSFTTPQQLFRKLVERFTVPPEIDEGTKNKIRLRVIIVLKHWIGTQFSDISSELVEEIYELVEFIKTCGLVSVAEQLERVLEQKSADRLTLSKATELRDLPPISAGKSLSGVTSPAQIIFQFKPLEIAKHMTLNASTIFNSIELAELVSFGWNTPSKRYQAPNVMRYIQSLNRVSFWVASMVLWYESPNQRAQAIKKFIQIATNLLTLGNFNCLMGVVGGLNLGCVSRLKLSFLSVSDRYTKKLAELHEVVLSPKSAWKNYRQALNSHPLPRIPYLGVHLADLTFIGDGNQSIIDGMVNFDKQLMVYKVLEQILICQQQPYHFEEKDVLKTFLQELPSLGEDELWKLSELREPRA